MTDPIVSFHNVTFAYEPHEPIILRDVSFDLAPHTFTTIVGPSGGGKSTLLQLTADLVKPQKGMVTNHARTCMVFQNAALLPWRTVHDNVLLGFTGLKLSKHEREHRIHTELQNLGLAEFAHAYPRDLSGGQRQRVGIARALVSDPELLLLDEPFSALDVETTRKLSEELLQIFASRQITMLMVSHDIEDAVSLADQVFVFCEKKIAHVVEVPLARPRHFDDLRFEHVVKEVKKLMPGR